MRVEFERELISHLPFLRRFALKLTGSAEAADDLAQETAAKALKAWEQFQPGTNMRGWLAFIQRNAFLSERRRAWRSVEMDDDRARLIPGPSNPAARLELSEALEALKYLPAEQSEALLLIAEGEDYETVAAMTNTEVGTVKSRVSRARDALDTFFHIN